MQRKRSRQARSLAVVAFMATSFSIGRCSYNCPARSALDAALCLQDSLPPHSEAAVHWRVALDDSRYYHFGVVTLTSQMQSLELAGNKTRVTFDTTHRWMGSRLSTLRLVGLDLTNSKLPELPKSLIRLDIVDCVMKSFPVAWLLSLSRLETLVVANNTLTDETLMETSQQQYRVLSSRLAAPSVNYQSRASAAEMVTCVSSRGGRVQELLGCQFCVVPDQIAISRNLQALMDSNFRGSNARIDGNGDNHMPILVLVSMALPVVYFLYKMHLFVSFMRAHYRNKRTEASRGIQEKTASSSSDDDRNCTTTLVPKGFEFRSHRKSDRRLFASNSAGFWVDEELQQWRLDFKRLKLLQCLNLPSGLDRRTLRKQSMTSAMNHREIWLASLAQVHGTTLTLSHGVSAENILVVAKFLSCTTHRGSRTSASSSVARDNLKSEMKRQAFLYHPHVVTFIGVAWSRETQLVAVTEYMTQGDLRHRLHCTAATESGKLTAWKLQMLLDVISALLYLHSMRPFRVHGNCNSRNVLLNESLRAKLSDFGVDSRADGLTDQELTSYSAVGSGRWISPEALMGCEISALYPGAIDVYSFGILIAEVDSHELPFSDLMQANRAAVPETDILQLIARGALSPTLSETCPESLVELVNACTCYKPKNRPSSAQVQATLMRILEEVQAGKTKLTA
ncbi:hypothetical protein CCR75_009589 [Bremia lactucae]|uniref:Protein kinase domain-containing protein n=1 Tax=Bremia lactucae TaxID=4779 RepID=A0A976ILP5_BRELC|nr:hypothetical protein CCR75_009589 [Bremia lactucae]